MARQSFQANETEYYSERGIITKEEGDVLLAIIKSQDIQKIKEGAYYALCGKKFLLDNHQPKKARPLLSKAISDISTTGGIIMHCIC